MIPWEHIMRDLRPMMLQTDSVEVGFDEKNELNKKLYKAARKGDLVLAQQLINDGALVNPEFKSDDSIATPLCEAIAFRQLEMVRFLISKGADVDLASGIRGGSTPLQLSLSFLQTGILDCLLINGADPNGIGNRGVVPHPLEHVIALSSAHIEFAVDAILKLRAAGANVIDLADDKLKVLMTLSGRRYVEPEFLSEISWALTTPVPKLSDLILEKPIVKPKNEVVMFDRVDLIDKYIDLVRAVERNNISLAQDLINEGVDINLGGLNTTHLPLCSAVEKNRLRMVKFLIANKANVNQEAHSTTPLLKAIEYGRKEIFDYLLLHGADVNLSVNDKSPLTQALLISSFDLEFAIYAIKELIAAGADADLSVKRKMGMNLLEYARFKASANRECCDMWMYLQLKQALEQKPVIHLKVPVSESKEVVFKAKVRQKVLAKQKLDRPSGIPFEYSEEDKAQMAKDWKRFGSSTLRMSSIFLTSSSSGVRGVCYFPDMPKTLKVKGKQTLDISKKQKADPEMVDGFVVVNMGDAVAPESEKTKQALATFGTFHEQPVEGAKTPTASDTSSSKCILM